MPSCTLIGVKKCSMPLASSSCQGLPSLDGLQRFGRQLILGRLADFVFLRMRQPLPAARQQAGVASFVGLTLAISLAMSVSAMSTPTTPEK